MHNGRDLLACLFGHGNGHELSQHRTFFGIPNDRRPVEAARGNPLRGSVDRQGNGPRRIWRQRPRQRTVGQFELTHGLIGSGAKYEIYTIINDLAA